MLVKQALQKGITAHKAGKAQEAGQYYTAILKVQPNHPDANHNMGVLAVGIGKVQEALPFFKTAVDADPKITQFWLSYIDALIAVRQPAKAKSVLDQAFNSGARGKSFDKLKEKLVVLSVDADDAFQYFNLAVAQMKASDLNAAIKNFQEAYRFRPNFPEAYNNLGNIFQIQGKLKDAISAYNMALKLKPDYADAYNNVGVAYQKQDMLEESLDALANALNIKENYKEALNNMGISLQKKGLLNEALEHFNRALEVQPDYIDALHNKGTTLNDLGRLDDATKAFKQIFIINPNFAPAYYSISRLHKFTSKDQKITQVENLLKNSDISEKNRCLLFYAHAKMKEDSGQFELAFQSYLAGGKLKQNLLSYDLLKDKRLFSLLKSVACKLKTIPFQIEAKKSFPIPIFILGMPRSGTTLIEQIISCHSQVHGAGELPLISMLANPLLSKTDKVTAQSLTEIRESYFKKLEQISIDKKFITDKTPLNFHYLGLIAKVFPEAKIIHTQRDPKATCWSNFKQYFETNGLGYSYNLNTTIDYYRLYRDLMNFWQSEYSDQIYNLNYESLTTDQEIETRKLVNYLELTWEEACLTPHKNERSVRTASQQQVRQKVYSGSSEAWRKYEPYLNGAFDSFNT